MRKLNSRQDLEALREELVKKQQSNKPRIAICNGTACHPYGCVKVIEAFNEMLNDISQGVTKEELQAMKATYIGEMIVTLGFSSIDYTYTMLNMLEGSYPLNYLSKLIDNINKVTVSDINKVAKQIFDKNKLVLISVGDDEKEKS